MSKIRKQTHNIANILQTNNVQRDGKWFVNGQLVNDEKILALGETRYYIIFTNKLSKKFNKTIYQPDFLVKSDENLNEQSIEYYIDTADEIYFNLCGMEFYPLHSIFQVRIGPEHIWYPGQQSDIYYDGTLPNETLREIKYIVNNNLQNKVFWYIPKQYKSLLLEYGISANKIIDW